MHDDYKRRRLTDGWPRSVPDCVADGLASFLSSPRGAYTMAACRLLHGVTLIYDRRVGSYLLCPEINRIFPFRFEKKKKKKIGKAVQVRSM